jgi:hypothetical protein
MISLAPARSAVPVYFGESFLASYFPAALRLGRRLEAR